jgi:hypothetical protein
MGKSKGRSLLGRPRRRWVDNVKIDSRKMGWGDMNWAHLTQVRDHWRALVNTAMNLRVLQNIGIYLRSLATGSFPRTHLHAVS